jgi:hypothetical protein
MKVVKGTSILMPGSGETRDIPSTNNSGRFLGNEIPENSYARPLLMNQHP